MEYRPEITPDLIVICKANERERKVVAITPDTVRLLDTRRGIEFAAVRETFWQWYYPKSDGGAKA